MRKLFILIAVVLGAQLTGMQAQIVQGKKFRDISDEMNRYYNNAGKKAPGYKQFKRWEWYYSTRTGKDGSLVDNAGLNKQAYLQSSVNRYSNNNRIEANTGSWVSLGPTLINSTGRGIGRANRIAFHPSDVGTLFLASASGGLWKTTNAGVTWFPLTDGIPNLCLSGVAVDPTNPNIIYILTGDADASYSGAAGMSIGKFSSGVLKSYDGGIHWTYTGLQWSETDQKRAYKLVMHPTNPQVLMVATSTGIYRTTDGGNNWTSDHETVHIWDIEFKPGDPAVVYAAGHNSVNVRIHKSTNHGETFASTVTITDLWGNNSHRNRVAIAVTPANPDFLYALLGPATGEGSFHGLYRSTDEGNNFSLRTDTPNILGRTMAGDDDEDQASYDLCIAVSPTNANRLATGGIRLWTSTDGGTNLIAHDENVSALNYYHGDLHDLIYHPLNNNLLYMIGDGGIYKSTDNGNSWNDANGTGLQITQYYRIGTDVSNLPTSENIMIGGTQDNGTNKRGAGGGGVFTRVDGADGMDCYIDPDNNSIYVWGKQNGVALKSYNSGASALEVCRPESMTFTAEGTWCTPVAEVADGTNEFVIGYRPATLVTDVGGTFLFTPFYHSGGGPVSGRTFVRTARGNADRIYAGDNEMSSGTNFTQKAYTTTNKGTNWGEIYSGVNEVPFTDLAFNADNGNEMWLTFGGYDPLVKVKYSNNGGNSWINLTGSLPNVPVNCIVFDDNNGNPGGAVYIGTDIGVFYRDNNLGDWIPFSNGLPVVEITDLEIHNAQGLLRAGTYGRGMWETSIYSNCSSNLTLNPGNTGSNRPYFFQASNTIQSTAFHAGSGANVFYKAGAELELKPGFQVIGAPGNVFRATIGPCGGGVPAGRQANKLTGFLVQ